MCVRACVCVIYSLSRITNSSSSCTAEAADADAALRDCGGAGARPPPMKSLMILGVAVSNPARFSVFKSFGSAMVRQFDVIPTTMSLASIPIPLRYSSSATCGWILPM